MQLKMLLIFICVDKKDMLTKAENVATVDYI